MVRRTRGCARCARRRVKCDERSPQCGNCGLIGKACPGIYQGLFMVHTFVTPNARPKCSIGAHPQETLSVQQPSSGHLYEQFLISKFVECLAKPSLGAPEHESWMTYLPMLASSSRTLNSSIRAATLAFFAQLTDNIAMKREADRWYSMALRDEQIHVKHLLRRQPAPEDICAPLMLMYYELIRPTGTGGWTKHLIGASKLLELRGSENCQTGVSHLLFKALRLLTTCLSISSGRITRFASAEWCNIPFKQSPKHLSDNLIDILLSVSTFLKDIKRGESQLAANTARQIEIPEQDLILLVNRLAQVESQYFSQGENTFDNGILYTPTIDWQPATSETGVSAIGGSDFCSVIRSIIFPASWAMFSHLCVLNKVGTSGVDHIVSKAADHCGSLLNFANSISFEWLSTCLNSGSRLHICFSLTIVADFSPLRSQRDAARAYLRRMGCEQFI